MSDFLNPDWKPSFGIIFTWFGMDKNGRIAVFVNNCWGDLPACLLSVENVEENLTIVYDYINEESADYRPVSGDKNGDYLIDLFAAWTGPKTKEEHVKYHDRLYETNKSQSDANLVKNKGLYIYYAVEGNYPGNDYPVGYDGETEMGDYFLYMVPNVYGSINDFPAELRKFIATSQNIDFEKDRLLQNNLINIYFDKMFDL